MIFDLWKRLCLCFIILRLYHTFLWIKSLLPSRPAMNNNWVNMGMWYQRQCDIVRFTIKSKTWWRHQMEIFSALLALCAGNSPVAGEIPAQRPVTQNFDVFFGLRLNKPLSKQSWGWWFETPSRPLWCHCHAKSYFKGFHIISFMANPVDCLDMKISFYWCMGSHYKDKRSNNHRIFNGNLHTWKVSLYMETFPIY